MPCAQSGRRPDRTRALNFVTTFRGAPGGRQWIAMPECFKSQGYFTSAAGKLYHDGMDDARSWEYDSNQTAWIVGCMKGDICQTDPATGWTNYIGLTKESAVPYTDEDLALTEGLKRLDIAHASGRPWWISIGVHRPHAPFRVPEGFHGPQLYPNGSIDVVKPPAFRYPPTNFVWQAGNWHQGIEPAATSDLHDASLGCPTCVAPLALAVEWRRWYYAAVTWMDHSLGRALTRLEEMGDATAARTITVFQCVAVRQSDFAALIKLNKQTVLTTSVVVVVLHCSADHGYQMGELNEWAKKTNTEVGCLPFVISKWKRCSCYTIAANDCTVLTDNDCRSCALMCL
eukprot:COSAG02_NODE_2203_length_9520_cov_14.356013_7_plen_343_part_00